MTDEKLPFKSLDKLPLFASDQELAIAIVGRKNATHWRKFVLPALERGGFPKVDTLHIGRAVPLVKRFYEHYFGLTLGWAMAPDGEKDWTPKEQRRTMSSLAAHNGEERVWIAKRIQKKIDDEERRRAAGQDVPPGDYGNVTEEQRQAIDKYRAERAAFYANRN